MSNVTTIILIACPNDKGVGELGSRLAGNYTSSFDDIHITEIVDLNLPWFLKTIHEIDWDTPDQVQVFLKDEHDTKFKMYSLT